ncbi:MAG: oxidoreductase [Promethearchaeota archaeon]
MNSTPAYNKFEPFTYKTLALLKQKIEDLSLDIPLSPELEVLQKRKPFSDRFIANRIAIQPMEGYDAKANGAPSEQTIRRYRRFANSGAGLIWFEATAISEDSCSNPYQLFLSEVNKQEFKKLISQVREKCNKTLKELGFKEKCLLILQLNHSGRYSTSKGKKFPLRGYNNPELDRAKGIESNIGKIVSDDEIKKIGNLWVEKALIAREIGFDGVDIKACHGYLISELLGARQREFSDYGGPSLEKRSKLLLDIIKKLNYHLGNNTDFIITSRLGVYDGIPYPGGFGNKYVENEKFPATIDLSEPIELIKKLYENGIRLLNITAGNPYYQAQITRPYNVPLKGFTLPAEHPLYSVHRLFNLAASVKKECPKDMVIVGSGYSYLRQYAGHAAAGLILENKVDICGFGRMAFANPNFPKQIFKGGGIDKNLTCITCSKCSQLMRDGKSTGCAIRDSKYR